AESSKLLDQLQDINQKLADEAVRAATGESAKAKTFMIIVVIIGVILALFLGIFITLDLTKPIIQAVMQAKAIEVGDFSQRLNFQRKDEIGQLTTALDSMAESLTAKARIAETIADGDFPHEVS
ncbi:MAG: HAMP domain-containing protein, partial [Deltaproteobacteria bacterium]|nr:HAMP domain-containing protein [Deltaproteobacteria bacterium]